MISEHDCANINLEVYVARNTPESNLAADVAWAVSGSVSLELLAETLPACLSCTKSIASIFGSLDRSSRQHILLGQPLGRFRADARITLTCLDVSGDLASWAARWLDDPTEMERAGPVCRIFATLWRSPARPSAPRIESPRSRESIGKEEGDGFEPAPSQPYLPTFGRRAEKTTSLANTSGKAYHDVERTPVVDSEKTL